MHDDWKLPRMQANGVTVEETARSLLKQSLSDGRTSTLKVVSGSMYPLIRAGDSVVVQQCDPAHLRIGSIILYEKQGVLIVHRLFRKHSTDEGVVLAAKADIARITDGPFEGDSLYGEVTAVRKRWGEIDLTRFPWKTVSFLLFVTSKLIMFLFSQDHLKDPPHQVSQEPCHPIPTA